MKNLFGWLVCLGLLASVARAQTPVPPPASQAEAIAATDSYKYITPLTLGGYSLAQSTGGVTTASVTNIANALINQRAILSDTGFGTNATLVNPTLRDSQYNQTFFSSATSTGGVVQLKVNGHNALAIADNNGSAGSYWRIYDPVGGAVLMDYTNTGGGFFFFTNIIAGGWNGAGQFVGNGAGISNLPYGSLSAAAQTSVTNAATVVTNAAGIRAITAQQTNYATLISMLGPLTNGLGGGGGGSQTPWTSTIDANNHALNNLYELKGNNLGTANDDLAISTWLGESSIQFLRSLGSIDFHASGGGNFTFEGGDVHISNNALVNGTLTTENFVVNQASTFTGATTFSNNVTIDNTHGLIANGTNTFGSLLTTNISSLTLSNGYAYFDSGGNFTVNNDISYLTSGKVGLARLPVAVITNNNAAAVVFTNRISSLGDSVGTEQFGAGATATNLLSTAVGYNSAAAYIGTAVGASSVAGSNALAAGYQASASALYSVAAGALAKATNQGAFSAGYNAQSDYNSTAVGTYSVGTGTNATVVGSYANAAGRDVTVVGATARATTNYGVAAGYGAFAGYYGTSVGYRANSESVTGSVAVGTFSIATNANYATAVGYGANAAHLGSTAIGSNALTTAANQVRLGTATTTVSVPGNLAVDGTITGNGLNITNLSGADIFYKTNAATIAPNFSLPYQLWSTNAAFTFGYPLNAALTNFNSCVVFVTNSTASAVAITASANSTIKTQGTWYVTNVTSFTFSQYGNKWTNAVALPLW